MESDAGGLFILIFAFLFYLLPTIIAAIRKAKRGAAIFALNLLLGWTILGWIGAFIWALADNKEGETVPVAIAIAPAPPPPSRGPTVEERLANLKSLRDRDLITTSEYEDRRASILKET